MRFFTFPDPVNEVAARAVAAGVVVLALVTLITQQYWILPIVAYGFVARVLAGPKISPLGQFATRVIARQLSGRAKLVPGPPKRFAQGMGAVVTCLATVFWLLGDREAATLLLGLILIAAMLEAVFAICIGCKIFAGLMKLGVIPKSVCERCNNLEFQTRSS